MWDFTPLVIIINEKYDCMYAESLVTCGFYTFCGTFKNFLTFFQKTIAKWKKV